MKHAIDSYYRLLKVVITLLMGLMVVPVLLQIVSRYTGFIPRYIWTEEIARFCFVWIIMIGSMIAVRDAAHFDVDLLPAPETPRQEAVGRLIVHVAMMVLALMFAWYGYDFAKFGWLQNSEMSGINMLSIYISFPLAGVTWVLFLAEMTGTDIQIIAGRKPGA
ncbi:MAG TPA: TRAP transporter small permease [Planctomycetes bacterium]|nr:TRAP transporter small permease [Fuerstiella sp.]HIK96183.1 TRAP transporter small permease [Planctomycetota bacterium]